MEFLIYTIGGFDIFVMIFNQIASLLKSNGGSLFAPMVKMATAIGMFYAVVYGIFGTQLRPLATWFVSYFIIMNTLLVPLATVIVKDTMTGQVRSIDNVPFALAFVSSNLSTLGYGMTQATEQVFQPSPRYGSGNSSGSSNTNFAALSYTTTGFIFGAHAISQLKSIHIPDDDLADNLHEFVNQFVVYDIANGNKYTRQDLKNSDNIWKLVSEKASKIRGFAWREVTRSNGVITNVPQTKIITCAQGVQRINQVWTETTQTALSSATSSLLDFFGFRYKGTGIESLNTQIYSNLPGTLNTLTGFSASANDRIRQQIMISSIIKGNELKSVELGGLANFDVRRAYLQQRSTYQTIGQVIAQGLPYLKNVLEALIYCLFIFVLPLSLIPQGWRVIGFWCKIVAWVQLWAPLFAILNFIMTEAMASQIMNRVTSSGGFTIANFVGIENATFDSAAIAGYLCTMIPLLSWALIERGGYAFVNMASSLLSISQGAASSAAAEGFSGNYSFGNISIGGIQVNNTSMLKSDASASYNAEHFALNDGISTRVVAGDGEQLLHIEQSTLPVSVNSSSYQEQAYRDAHNKALSTQESESKLATGSKMKAAQDFVSFSEQASKHESSNKQWSDHQTASFMKDTGSVYNTMKDISGRYGIEEGLIAQAALETSAGFNFGDTYLGGLLGISAGAATNTNQMSNASATMIEDEVVKLGKSKEFKSAVSHAQEYAKFHNYDIGDQNLKQSMQNFSENYEQSHTHQKNASAAYEKSQNLSEQIDYVTGNAQRIDTLENQRFANWATEKLGGIDQLEHVSRNNLPLLQEMGRQYFVEYYAPPGSHGVTESHLRSGYEKAGERIDKAHNITPNFERTRDLAAENDVSVDQTIDQSAKRHATQGHEDLVAQVGFDEQRRKTEVKNAEEEFKDLEREHRKNEFGMVQHASAKRMYTRHEQNMRLFGANENYNLPTGYEYPQVHALQDQNALVTRVQFDDYQRKMDAKHAGIYVDDLERGDKRGELASKQQVPPKKVYTGHVKNSN